MMMNSNLILQAGQGADILGAMQRGNALAGQVNDQRRQNALAGFMKENGAALMQGDQNVLAQYAQYDPQAAMGIMERQQDRQWRADERDYQRQRDAVSDRQQDRQFAMQEARYAKQDERADQEWQWKVEEYAAKKSQAEREAEAAQIEGAVKMGLAAQTPEQWDQIVTQAGAADLVGQFENRQAITQQYMTISDILKGQNPTPQSGPGKVQADINAGLLPAGTPLRGEGTTVKVDMGGGAPGLGKLSTDFGYVMDANGNPIIDPNTGLPQAAAIPGSPAALEAAAAAQKSETRTTQAAKAADVVVQDIDKAIGQVSGWTAGAGSALSAIPGTGARDLQASLDTVRANIGFDRLQQMREASPTGGALGGIAIQELQMLQAVLGSLDTAQSPDQLRANLVRLKEVYEPIAAKAAAYPNASQFGFDGGQSAPVQSGRFRFNPDTGDFE